MTIINKCYGTHIAMSFQHFPITAHYKFGQHFRYIHTTVLIFIKRLHFKATLHKREMTNWNIASGVSYLNVIC